MEGNKEADLKGLEVGISASASSMRSKRPPEPLSPSLPKQCRLSAWLNAPIREDIFLEIELLALAFSTGLQDATTYPDYLCFASNQTGNTVFLAIGVSGIAPGEVFSFANIGVSLSLFILGGWIMGQIGNTVGPRRRMWLLISSMVQTLMVIAAAAIQYTLPIKRQGPAAWTVLTLLAFSSGGQVAMARGVKITEITTAMATAAYIDVLVDPRLWARHNRSRNRRVAFLIMLTAGSFAGAYAHKFLNSAFALLVSAVIKMGVTAAFGFNMRMVEDVVLKTANTTKSNPS